MSKLIVARNGLRAVLALVAVVALVFGTAHVPAAFGVEPAAVPEDAVGSGAAGSGDDDEGTPTDDGRATPTPTPTPSPTPSTAEPTEDGAGSGDSTETPTATPAPTAAASSDRGGSGPSWPLLLALLIVAAGGAALFGGGSGRDDGVGPLPSLPRVSLPRLSRLTATALFQVAGGLARTVEGVAVAAASASTAMVEVGAAARLLAGGLAAVPRVAFAPLAALGGFSTDSLGAGLVQWRRSADDAPTDDARDVAGIGAGEDDESAEPDPVDSVAEAWRRLAGRLTVENPDARTPGEYARRAVEAGLPSGPVRRLTRLFREVRYGGRAETDARVARARRALDALRGGDD